jgi:hypothetical protein
MTSYASNLCLRLFMLRPRPHPACLDGEEDGGLVENRRLIRDPIRLVRMVRKIIGC